MSLFNFKLDTDELMLACERRYKRALYRSFSALYWRLHPGLTPYIKRIRALSRISAVDMFGWEVEEGQK